MILEIDDSIVPELLKELAHSGGLYCHLLYAEINVVIQETTLVDHAIEARDLQRLWVLSRQITTKTQRERARVAYERGQRLER